MSVFHNFTKNFLSFLEQKLKKIDYKKLKGNLDGLLIILKEHLIESMDDLIEREIEATNKKKRDEKQKRRNRQKKTLEELSTPPFPSLARAKIAIFVAPAPLLYSTGMRLGYIANSMFSFETSMGYISNR